MRTFTVLLLILTFSSSLAIAQWSNSTVGELGDISQSRGVSWCDFDNDGDEDLFLANNGINHLWRNDGEDPLEPGQWLFNEAGPGDGSGISDDSRGSVGIWGDYDNDGDNDLYLANDEGANALFRNDPANPEIPEDPIRVFVDVTTGLLGTTRSTQSVNWVDYDKDGDIDLYISNRTENILLRNDGEDFMNPGHWLFSDVSESSGLDSSENTQGSAWCDFDNDNDVDLYLVNYGSDNLLFRNDGGTFIEIGASVGVDDADAGRGATWGDFDNDGYFDLYVTNYGGSNKLYKNIGGVFTELAEGMGVDNAGNSRGSSWLDYDNDGNLDLIVANSNDGSVTIDNVLYHNEDGMFVAVVDTVIADAGGFACTVSLADYNEDGLTDIYLSNWSGNPNALFRNDTPDTNSYLKIKLTGKTSNLSGFGTRVQVWADSTLHTKDLISSDGYLTGNSQILSFGLGSATVIDSVLVNWTSGVEQVLTDVAVNQLLHITESGIDTPLMYSEPVFTDGLENSVQWTNEAASGAVEYEVVSSLSANFDTIYDGSGWIADTSWTFTALPDSATIWYHVHSRDIEGIVSRWSPPVFSTQDNSPPTSQVQGPEGPIAGLPFSLEYVAADGASGVAGVELWYNFEGGDFIYYGSNNEGSFNFTIPDGGGIYSFYTIATDQLGHIEEIPIEADLVIEVTAPLWFNVAPDDGSGIGNDGNSRGIAWGDYDNDGNIDLYVSNRVVWSTGADHNNHLFHNEGPESWEFTDTTNDTLALGGYNQAATWGDFDGDGDLDLYASDMQVSPSSPAPNSLFLNIGDGTFVDIAPDIGLDDIHSSRSVAWVDYDSDGDLDLYLASNGRNRLWRNDGGDVLYPQDWVFTDVAPADSTGIGDGQYTMGATWADYDNDGDPDLFLNNYYGGVNRLFRNDGEDIGAPGEWLFVDVAPDFGLDLSDNGLGVEFGDYNNDGLLDILLGSDGTNHLFKAVGDGLGSVVDYEDVSIEAGIDVCDDYYTTGATFADYDNDGLLDILFGNHWDTSDDFKPNFLLHNDGEDLENPGVWTFTDVSPADGYGIADGASTNGVAWADYDNDGDLDVYFATMTGGKNKLFRNDVADSTGNNWLHVDLKQPDTRNLRGVGSMIRIVTADGNQMRYTNTGSGFLTQHSLTAEFGLGSVSSVDTLEVTWPDGMVQSYVGIGVNQKFLSQYNANQVAVDDIPSRTNLGNNYPNPFNPLTTISFTLPERQQVTLAVYAIDGSLVRTLVDDVMDGGPHLVQFDGRDNRGAKIASGAYLYRMKTADKTTVRRMMLVR